MTKVFQALSRVFSSVRRSPSIFQSASSGRRLYSQEALDGTVEFQISRVDGTSVASAKPFCSVLKSGDGVVAWQMRDAESGSRNNIFFKLISAITGIPYGKQFKLPKPEDLDFSSHYLCPVDNLAFWMLYQSNYSHFPDNGIYATILSLEDTGTVMKVKKEPFSLTANSSGRGSYFSPVATTLSNGQIAVAFAATSPRYGIYCRIFSPAGNAISETDLLIGGLYANNNNTLHIASTNDGGFVVVWQDQITSNTTAILSQKVKANGETEGKQMIVTSGTPLRQPQNPKVAVVDQSIGIIWEEYDTRLDRTNIYFQVFDTYWSPGNKMRIGAKTPSETSKQSNPNITSIKQGQNNYFSLIWDGQGPGDLDGVFLQDYDRSGVKKTEIINCNSENWGVQITPSISIYNPSRYLTAWAGNLKSSQVGDYHIIGRTLVMRVLLNVDDVKAKNDLSAPLRNNFIA